MSCDVGKATEGFENKLWHRWSNRKSSFSNLSVASPTSQLILQLFRRFTYVTAHSPTFPLLHLYHSSFFNPSFTSLTSQALYLPHLASRPFFLPFILDFKNRVHIKYKCNCSANLFFSIRFRPCRPPLGLRVTPLILRQRAQVRSPVGSISWLRFLPWFSFNRKTNVRKFGPHSFLVISSFYGRRRSLTLV